MHPRLTGRSARIGVIPALTAVLVTLAGCSAQEIAYTRGDVEVTPHEAVTDIDACEALSAETQQALGIAELEPNELLPPAEPGCEWEGANSFVTPSLTIWVTEPTDPDPTEEIVTIDDETVNVYSRSEDAGRYVAHFDDVTLSVNYLRGSLEIDIPTALELAMSDVLAHYHR